MPGTVESAAARGLWKDDGLSDVPPELLPASPEPQEHGGGVEASESRSQPPRIPELPATPPPLPARPESVPVNWQQVYTEIGGQPMSATDPDSQREVARAGRRLELQDELGKVQSWLTYFEQAADRYDPLATPRTADERDDKVYAYQFLQERREAALPEEHIDELQKALRKGLAEHGQLDELTTLMLDNFHGQYEYARLRSQRGGEPPSLWQLPQWLAYQGGRFAHWLKDDLGLRLQVEVWDGKLADQDVGGFIQALAKAMVKLPIWILQGIGGWGERLTSADVQERRATLGQWARNVGENITDGLNKRLLEAQRAGASERQLEAIRLSADDTQFLATVDMVANRMEAAAYMDILSTMRRQEVAEQATRQGGFRGRVGELADWQGIGAELRRPSFYAALAGAGAAIFGGPLVATAGGIALAVVAARRWAKRGERFTEQEQQLLGILQQLGLSQGQGALEVKRKGGEPVQFTVKGIVPSTREIILAHEDGKRMVRLTPEELQDAQRAGTLTFVNTSR